MYRQIITPTNKEHSIELPENLYGKQIEITVKEIIVKTPAASGTKRLPARLKNKAFWENIDYNPAFPSVEEIRQKAWPKNNG
jgi:hypothetical protein